MAKDQKKKSFVLFADFMTAVSVLTDEQAGRLFKMIFAYVNGKDFSKADDPAIAAMFEMFRTQIDREAEKWAEKCRRNKEYSHMRKCYAKTVSADVGRHPPISDDNIRQPSTSDVILNENDSDNDSDNVNANVNVNGNANGNVNDIDMSVLSGTGAPSVAEVIEASHNHGIEMSEKDAEEFIIYYFMELKGIINGEPIRNWRKLLKSWDEHKLVEPSSVFGEGYEGYEKVYCKLPFEIQEAVNEDQEKFEGMLTRATARRVTELRKVV